MAVTRGICTERELTPSPLTMVSPGESLSKESGMSKRDYL